MAAVSAGAVSQGGYVVQHDDLAQDVWKTLELPVRKPEYTALLEIGIMDTDRTTLMGLPASTTEMIDALKRVGAVSWAEVSFRCADCRVPALRDAFSLAHSVARANDAAECLAALPEEQLPKYKALLGALNVTELSDALDLMQRLDEYVLTPEQRISLSEMVSRAPEAEAGLFTAMNWRRNWA